MSKEIRDYLHLYYGQQVVLFREGKGKNMSEPYFLNSGTLVDWDNDRLCLILRPLSDMTEEEAIELGTMLLIPIGSKYSRAYKNNDGQWVVRYGNKAGEFWIIDGAVFNQHQTIYLLSKHFDLFGLIEAGLAIDSTTLK